jgi:hypothetical protein
MKHRFHTFVPNNVYFITFSNYLLAVCILRHSEPDSHMLRLLDDCYGLSLIAGDNYVYIIDGTMTSKHVGLTEAELCSLMRAAIFPKRPQCRTILYDVIFQQSAYWPPLQPHNSMNSLVST